MKGAGGGKRRGRKPARTEPDDRPRGYETRRMRQLWRDIDDAKHKAGLGTPAEPAAPTFWDLAGIVERATAFAGEAAAWVTSAAPSACALLTSGAALLRDVPVLGRIVALVPASFTPAEPARRDGGVEAHVVRSTDNGAHAERRGGEPNGEWIH